MNILKRYEGDDFDESYAFDDAAYGDFEESDSSKPFLVKAIAMILAVTGIAYGANIALTGSNSSTEFGQGYLTTAACDTNGGITVIPMAGFINETGPPASQVSSPSIRSSLKILMQHVSVMSLQSRFTQRQVPL